MIKFKLNGKPLQIPSSWDDVTLSQHLEITKTKTGISGLISIFTGIHEETLKTAKIEGLNEVIEALSFVRKAPNYSGEVTNIGKYKLPLNSKGVFDIQFETLGQFEDLRAIMMAMKDDNQFESFAKACAIYLQKVRDGEYNHEKAMSMVPEVYNMPSNQVMTAGSFFFLKLVNLLSGTETIFPATSQAQKKSNPVSQSSNKSSGRTGQYRKSRSK